MYSDSSINAADIIHSLRKDIDEMWKKYNGCRPLGKLDFDEGLFGIMQREELPLLYKMLDDAKEHVDWLDTNCRDMMVLIIDDNVEFLNVIEQFLQKNDIKAETVASGKLGLQRLSENPDKYTIVMLDIQMDEMDGFSVLQHIRENKNPQISSMPVIAMSGKVDAQNCVDFNYYIRKPIDIEKIIPSIYSVLNED